MTTLSCEPSRATILQGDCLEVLRTLPSGSVHCCVTSPPYWGLRDYGIDGQLGLEPTQEEYTQKLVEVFREVRRVLRDDGTLWLNLGDSYNGSCMTGGNNGINSQGTYKVSRQFDASRYSESLKPKDLVGIPWRVAFALQADGWYLRSDIIWHKPNPMPESVTDRPTKAHEYIFLLAKSQRYFYDQEAVREDNSPTCHTWKTKEVGKKDKIRQDEYQVKPQVFRDYMPSGRNRRTVWTVATQGFPGAHFATYPPKLIEPCILAGTSERGCCPECGKPWVRMVEKQTSFEGGSGKAGRTSDEVNSRGKWAGEQHGENIKLGPVVNTSTTGWRAACSHNIEPIPCTVLDPFNGAGTTGLVSIQNNRRYIGVELNPEYIELTYKRLAEIQPRMIYA